MQKVLIVEDEKAISGVLQHFIRRTYRLSEILVAEDGLEAYKLLEKMISHFDYFWYQNA